MPEFFGEKKQERHQIQLTFRILRHEEEKSAN